MSRTFQFTFNAVLMIIIGLGLMVYGGSVIIYPQSRVYGAAFIPLGIGNILFGLTNGFTNMTPNGRLLYRFGLLAYFGGVPLIGYYVVNQIL